MKAAAVMLAVASALAGCSSGDATQNEAHAAAVIENAAELGDANAVRGLPVADEAASLEPGAVPPAFEGRWGLTPADCDIARSDTMGKLSIRGNALTFSDASATAKVIGGPSRYKVVADLSFSDRGRKWQGRETLELTSAGTVLVRTGQSPAKTYRYERC